MKDIPPIIVCAAIRNRNTGVIICGPRHGNCINTVIETEVDTNPSCDIWVCGFVDQNNNFLTREEAWKIADANGQLRRPTGYERNYNDHRPPNVGDNGYLFSENLY